MIFLDHFAAFFDHADYIVARILTLVGSIGAVLVAVRAMIQNLHASQAVDLAEYRGTVLPAMTGKTKKEEALTAMASAPLLLRASPARADKLIERKVAKLKARTSRAPG